jgi:hypothetical protein
MTLALEIGFMSNSVGLRPAILIVDEVRKRDWAIFLVPVSESIQENY